MATYAEAHNINVLLRYLLNIPRPDSRVPNDEEALAAAEALALRAYGVLGAGVSPGVVTQAWKNRRGPMQGGPVVEAGPCPSGCGPMMVIDSLWYCPSCTTQVDPRDTP